MPDDLIVEPAASNLADHRLGVKVVRKTEFERACFVQLVNCCASSVISSETQFASHRRLMRGAAPTLQSIYCRRP